jgi:hypothetical protein
MEKDLSFVSIYNNRDEEDQKKTEDDTVGAFAVLQSPRHADYAAMDNSAHLKQVCTNPDSPIFTRRMSM